MADATTIAIPYARAVFQIAESEGKLDEWAEQLGLLAEIAANPEMSAVLGNPAITRDDVAALVTDIAGDALSDKAKNLIRVLAENDRITLLPELLKQFNAMKTLAENRIEAEVISARKLNAAQRKSIEEGLKRRFGKDVSLTEKVDKSLIGGAIIRAGDLVIDGSVKGKLAKLETVVTR
ncbi:MAG: F0F1 ATP synthase subunit delta [Gammaproteobacteria bacterium]|nr:MAG: F0F1 ATP synthase subunit delta [Gammaproteobacteria bacterium]